MSAGTARTGAWYVVALVLLVALTAGTRLRAPWAMGVTNDEMLHLRSFRNHYGTDDVYPLFLVKLERTGLLRGERLATFEKLYRASPLVQRSLCVLTDLHPPIFPVLAELIETLSHSSLIAVRLPSVIASILAVLFMERLGRELRDRTLGLWLASLMAMGFMAQTYAGIARPYALAQCAEVLAFWMFARDRRRERRSPWRFLLAALFAQGTNWLVWALMGPLVVIELGRRLRAGTGVRRLAAQTWWYVLPSVLLLPLLAVQLSNPGTYQNTGRRPVEVLWYHFCLASPFANLDSALGVKVLAILAPAGFLLLVPMLTGLAAVLGDRAFCGEEGEAALVAPSVRAGLVAMLLSSVVTAVFGVSGTRMSLIYILAPTILAGIGLRWLLRGRRTSEIAAGLVLATFLILRLRYPEDPYRRAFWSQTDYAAVARQVQTTLSPGDRWCAFPRQLADCLYRYADLPEPVPLLYEDDLEALVRTMPPREGGMVFFVRTAAAERYLVLRFARRRTDFFNGFTVVRLPAAPSPPRGPRRGPFP